MTHDVMLQLQEKDVFFIILSKVSCLPASLLAVQGMTSSPSGSGILSLIWNAHSQTHKLPRAHKIKTKCSLTLVHANTHGQTHTYTHSKYTQPHIHKATSVWQMKEVNCLSLTSWMAAGGYECTVIWREGKWICWLSLFVSEAISHLSFAPYFHYPVMLSFFSNTAAQLFVCLLISFLFFVPHFSCFFLCVSFPISLDFTFPKVKISVYWLGVE